MCIERHVCVCVYNTVILCFRRGVSRKPTFYYWFYVIFVSPLHWCLLSTIYAVLPRVLWQKKTTGTSLGLGGIRTHNLCIARAGPNFMALLTVSTSALTEAGNSVLTVSVFHGLYSGEFWLLHVRTLRLLGILRLQGQRRNSACT